MTWREGFFELPLNETSGVRTIIRIFGIRKMVIQDYLGERCESLAFNDI